MKIRPSYPENIDILEKFLEKFLQNENDDVKSIDILRLSRKVLNESMNRKKYSMRSLSNDWRWSLVEPLRHHELRFRGQKPLDKEDCLYKWYTWSPSETTYTCIILLGNSISNEFSRLVYIKTMLVSQAIYQIHIRFSIRNATKLPNTNSIERN